VQVQQSSSLNSVKAPHCPVCKDNLNVIPIIYGLRSPDVIQLAESGKVELGSHFYSKNAANWRCKTCGLGFVR